MLIVELKSLHEEAGKAAEFLHSKMKRPVEAQGSQLRLPDARARDVKLLLHKFLHHKGLDSYRVEVVHSGLVEVFGPEHVRPHRTAKGHGSPPSPGATMPYAFPFSPSLPGGPVRKPKAKGKQYRR